MEAGEQGGCAHGNCLCAAGDQGFCSSYCESEGDAGEAAGSACQCGHPECRAAEGG
ncbi:MAG TPA: hypothetical protein VFD92_22185 [Candidatus Binatia bacterium]|nr:hypothetical protein [Candidatus Binatia bacterium]